MGKILDVREMVPKDRHSKIFETFNALDPGTSFVLVNDHEPKPLLYQFQAEHDGEFDWWPLEQGPQVWRVRISKREAAGADRTITDYLQTDHRRLDGIMERFQDALRGERWEEALSGFKEFVLGLRKHIRIEEEILFPVFEEKTGMIDAGPTFVMKMEHKEINELLDRILAATAGHDGKTASEAAGALISILMDHNMKEEHILYPESDAFITDAERAQIIKKAQAA
ncbi:Iron-sulfur cluster repair protein YtfE [uncultured bacterium]|nr:Iron-sulfur cluster repair protein YtfE [uncultured bacterium]